MRRDRVSSRVFRHSALPSLLSSRRFVACQLSPPSSRRRHTLSPSVDPLALLLPFNSRLPPSLPPFLAPFPPPAMSVPAAVVTLRVLNAERGDCFLLAVPSETGLATDRDVYMIDGGPHPTKLMGIPDLDDGKTRGRASGAIDRYYPTSAW